ncbi:GTPase [Metabacillus arenae]|uniref:50S ribosome-binding GTPase n=1 Tax=Metabacillus arenae TaxID=2771434 RepID=A0A926NKZ2_9BACI|nr:GTPase [Metabacillus arenae]MBD1382528.1 50S ribosome-binding GTPase [Metabacillus arenae]
MTEETRLINKTYYETFLADSSSLHPVQVLGEAYMEEQTKEIYDLSYVRYAQGEVYFQHKDYEAAIFKWENINNELESWAKKNIADSYYELGLLSSAEDTYTAINSDSKSLSMEISLQLFSLYLERGKLELAYEVLGNAIELDPDYPNVTEIAKNFYEDQVDWKRAVELAVAESIRTESVEWFEVLLKYADKGYTKAFAPDYFYQVLITLYRAKQQYFKLVTSSLWNNYKTQDTYLSWLKTVNTIFLNINVNARESWEELAELHQQTYLECIAGQYLIKELEDVIPVLLGNWLKITSKSKALFASTAILAWSEVFPSSIDSSDFKAAENLIFNNEHEKISLDNSLDLFKTLMKWAENNHLEVSYLKPWLVSQLSDLRTTRIAVAGMIGSGKSSFINSMLEEKLLEGPSPTVFVRTESDVTEMNEISHTSQRPLSDISELQKGAIVELKWPSRFLHQNDLSFIQLPGFEQETIDGSETLDYLPLADGLLFVLDAGDPFTEEELNLLVKIKENAPEVPMHFLLNKMDILPVETDVKKFVEEMEMRVKGFFPQAQVFPYSSLKSVSKQQGLAEFMKRVFQSNSLALEELRSTKLLYLIRRSLTELLNNRVAMENHLIETVHFNEDILGRLNGLIHHIEDLEGEKVREIKESYQSVKGEMRRDLLESIPELLRGCANLLSEDSDFSQIHVELNNKMNDKIQAYFKEDLVPRFSAALQEWIESSHKELLQSQSHLNEMCNSFNGLYGEEKMKLQCDFKVVEDWRRDITRMTNRAEVEDENILLRFKPAEFLLKSAGRLFGAIPQNKSLLYNQYKKYLENKNYDDVAKSIADKFFLEFNLFEKALKADISMFFKAPFSYLTETVAETEMEINEAKEMLEKMESNPEVYYDPLKLFEVRLLQYEFMVRASEETPYIHSN